MYFVLAIIFVAPIVLAYAAFVRWLDRYEPEPLWALSAAFVWGGTGAIAGSVVVTVVADAVLQAASGVGAAGLEATSATLVAPLVEESWKGLGVVGLFVVGHLILRELDGPLDGVIYGGMIGLGFTLTEDVLYVGQAGSTEGAAGFAALVVVRTILGGLGHCLYTSLTGLGFGAATRARSRAVQLLLPVAGFGAAVLLHTVHNGLATAAGPLGVLVAIPLTWIEVAAWLALVAVLVLGDREVVRRQLRGELGGLVRDEAELARLCTVVTRSVRLLAVWRKEGFGAYRRARRRDHALVELALVKERIARGSASRRLERAERARRDELSGLGAAGT
jgi:RsiW-degrading membrane proteinase PrsW (M82 family)